MERKKRAEETHGASETRGTHTTAIRPVDQSAPSEATQLLVLEAKGLTVQPLSDTGSLSIGRAEECDVRLRDPLASRRHATLHLAPLAIEDHGSANGTLLGGVALEAGQPQPLQVGQAVVIGNSLLIVRRAGRAVASSIEPGRSSSSSTRVVAVKSHVVQDPVMDQLYQLARRLARGSINVLILGETGVGKEVVAETVHGSSPRSGAPLVRINCAALSESLLESELFGHERGAFTGAVSAKPGLIEMADGGTVFLDEVGELPASLQAKLLRVVETREVTRVGGVRSHLVDVRFLSATNRSLAAEVARGAFRPDLMFRLNGASLEVPPLRERPLEIGPLVELFLGRVAAQLNLPQAPTLSSAALEALHAHAWPGNVRELRNVIERAVLIHAGDKIEAQDLALLACPPLEARGSNTRPPPTDLDTAGGPGSALLSSEAERERIMKALRECGGNQSRAAKFLNMPRRTLVRRIALLGLPRPRDVGDADDADDADD